MLKEDERDSNKMSHKANAGSAMVEFINKEMGNPEDAECV